MGGHNLWLGNHRSVYPIQLAPLNPRAGRASFRETEGPSYGILTSHGQQTARLGLAPEPTGTPAFPLPHARPDYPKSPEASHSLAGLTPPPRKST